MAKYKAYPEYKDSGVEWLGCVPMGWLITELKRYSWVKGGYAFSSDSFISFGEPVIRIGDISQDGSINLENCKHVSHILAKQSRSYTVRNGDLLMAMTGATIGKAGFYECELPALINQRVGLFKVLDNLMHYRFLWYTLKSYGYQEYIKLTAFGGAQPNISDVGMVGYRTTVPSLQEQSRIASFLDHETAKIDSLIEKQQQLIELLKEKRQAVISHAVTRGLNPDVPMKDSGVEWLGDVPEHWTVSTIKHISTFIGTGGTPKNSESFTDDDGIDWFSPGDFNGSLALRHAKKKITTQAVSNGDAKSYPKDSIVVIGIGATLGKVAFVEHEFSCNQQINIITPSKTVDHKYLTYSLLNQVEQMKQSSNASTIGIMNQEKTKQIWIAFPPKDEQIKILSVLSQKEIEFDELLKKSEYQILLLQERRTALISAAVTGKIDVRDWVAPDTQDVEEPQEATA